MAVASRLESNTRLRVLCLDGCAAGTAAVEALAGALLRQLDAAAGSAAAAAARSALHHQQQAQQGGRAVNVVGDRGNEPAPGLEVLELRRNQVRDLEAGVAPVVRRRAQCGMRATNTCVQIGPAAAEALARVISHPMCALSRLYLGHNAVETPGALAIARALQASAPFASSASSC